MGTAVLLACLFVTESGRGAERSNITILRDAAEGVSVLVSGVRAVDAGSTEFGFAAQHAALQGRFERLDDRSLRLILTVTPRKTAFKETTFTLDETSFNSATDTDAGSVAGYRPRRFELTKGGLRLVGCLHLVEVPDVPIRCYSLAIEVTPGLGRDLAPGPTASCSVTETGRGLAIRLSASDPDDPNPAIWLLDTLSGFQAGPFRNGDVVLMTINASARLERRQQKGAGEYTAFVKFQGEPLVFAVNADNVSSDPSLCR